MQKAQETLQKTFGYSDFRHNQKDIIQEIIGGGDAFVLMPTGGGKSLCYQIPSMVRDGVGVIVSPLIALMQDQVDALTQLGIKAAFLNSTMTGFEQQEVEEMLLRGELQMLYVAPERVLAPQTLNLLKQCEIALFAIDEAHCVSQWGHDFRPEYQRLSALPEQFPNVPRIALTATADNRTRAEIIHQLKLDEAGVYVNSFDRPNITYTIAEGQNARDKLLKFITNKHDGKAGIVYCLSRKKVESTAEWLSDKGLTALPYHAGLPVNVRAQNQKRFLREEGIIIVATIAFGMGIDKPNVRFVAHLSLPKNIEAYYQETGRAGRDGDPADAWMSYGLQDVIFLRQMMMDSNGSEEYKRLSNQKLDAMLGLCEMASCRRQAILSYFDEEMKEPCGNCDNCLNPPETWDATEDAQKALSTVYRTGQRFGVAYLIKVLLGKSDDRIVQFGHDKVSTWGIGENLKNNEWSSLFRQLISQGFLNTNSEYGGVELTEKSRPLLRGEESLIARKYRKPEKSASTSRSGKGRKLKTELRAIDEELFEALRECRTELANEQGVPSFVIFSDASLIEMAKKRPHTDETFKFINGVGDMKLERYGEQFMDVIREYPLPELLNNNFSDTINETLALYNEGVAIETIAEKRELSMGTVYAHLADVIEAGMLSAADVLDIDDADITTIENTAELLNSKQENALKPLFDELEGEFEYGVLRCVISGM
jgi:ATP-dependent DNA helicase RecQ